MEGTYTGTSRSSATPPGQKQAKEVAKERSGERGGLTGIGDASIVEVGSRHGATAQNDVTVWVTLRTWRAQNVLHA